MIWPQNAKRVSSSAMEGFRLQNVLKHFEDMPRHPYFANSAFGNPWGESLVDRIYLRKLWVCMIHDVLTVTGETFKKDENEHVACLLKQ